MTALTAPIAAETAGGGAPLGDIALVAGIISVATIAMLVLIVRYRAGQATPLRAADTLIERRLGMPGWAVIPGVGALVAVIATFMGAIWDIGVHIDLGRDEGPFGTTAHYPLLIGLVTTYLMGVLAVGMAPRKGRPTSAAAVDVPALGPVPVGALLILAGGGFAMLGFPLDDLWHRLFGQDVTLWGPTHTMFFGGIITAASGVVILLAEGARTAGLQPFDRWWRAPLVGVLGGIFLFVGTHITDEFNWAVPQYRQVWHPMFLAFFGALGLILARSLGGRGATIAALAAYLPLQFIEVGLIGILDTTQPASPIYVAEAIIVELVFLRAAGRGTLRIGALAGLAVGTVGFAAEYAWSHVAMPLPWRPGLLAEAIPVAALAGVAGGVLAFLMAKALTGGLADVRRPLAAALGATVVVVALGVNAGISTAPGSSAELTLSNVRTAVTDGGEPTRVADLEVRLDDAALGVDGNWAYVLGWQGGSRHAADLVPGDDGVLRSSRPVPIGDDWKAFVRVHKGRTLAAVPIRMPADPEIDFAGFPAEPTVTRPLARDSELMQLERRDDGPTWAWTPAMILVMAMNLSLMALVAAGCVRSGRGAAVAASGPGPDGPHDVPVAAPARELVAT